MIELKDLTPEMLEMAFNPNCEIKNWEKLRQIGLLRLGKRRTLEEVAQIFGVSKERIRQYQVKLLLLLNVRFGTEPPTLLKESCDYSLYKLKTNYLVYEKLTRISYDYGDKEKAENYYQDLVEQKEKVLAKQ